MRASTSAHALTSQVRDANNRQSFDRVVYETCWLLGTTEIFTKSLSAFDANWARELGAFSEGLDSSGRCVNDVISCDVTCAPELFLYSIIPA